MLRWPTSELLVFDYVVYVDPQGLSAIGPSVIARGSRLEVVIDHLNELAKDGEDKIKLVAGYPNYAGDFDEIVLDKRKLLSNSRIRLFIWRGEGKWEVKEYEPLTPVLKVGPPPLV